MTPWRGGCTACAPWPGAAAGLAGLRRPARRAPQARRDPGTAPPRVPRAASRRVPLHPVLRDLSPLARPARPDERQIHHAGEKLFVDYAGQMPSFIDPATGERISIELFVAILGASNYTYAEATLTQQLQDWIASHQRAFAFVGGVTAALVCDQLKSGVVIPCRYEPGLQRTYEELAQHYGTVIVPARPAHARDKAKVEVAVRVVERWILARLRHETFFSLAALNARIAALLADLTARPMASIGPAAGSSSSAWTGPPSGRCPRSVPSSYWPSFCHSCAFLRAALHRSS